MTTNDPRLSRAIAAMDLLKNKDGVPDYKIKPSEHAGKLAADAPELAGLLNHSDIKNEVNEYEAQALKARTAQATFRRWWLWASWCAFAFTVASGLVMAFNAGLSPDNTWRSPLVTACSILAVVSGSVGGALLAYLKKTDLFKKWRSARATAEDRRCAIASTLTRKTPPQGADPVFVRLCQLEYVRKILLDSQIDFYTTRGAQHETEASRLAIGEVIAGVLVGIAALGVGSGVLAGGSAAPWLPVLGVIAGAITALIAGFDQVYQHNTLATSYENARSALRDVMALLDQTREAILQGKLEALDSFVDAMLSPMKAEHQAWREAVTASDPAYQRLAQVLGVKDAEQNGSPNTGGGS